MILLITGGHPTPALAVMDEVYRAYPEIQICFVGRRYVNPRESRDSYEYSEVTSRGVRFVHLEVERGMRGVLTFPYSLWRCIRLVKDMHPDRVLSFGGYIALPIAVAAWLLGIPVFTHEQTAVPGRANQIIGYLARKIFVSFPMAVTSSHTIYTGNPVRKAVVQPPTFSAVYGHLPRPWLLINGGNLGSHSLNVHIFSILETLLQTFTVIHQTGNVVEYGDYETARAKKEQLNGEYASRYIPVTHLATPEWGYVLSQTDVMVSRSGANNFIEAIATQTPCVLVPLPWSARDEQRVHASILQKAGVAEVFQQAQASTLLLQLINQIHTNRSQYADKYRTLGRLYVPEAAHHIIDAIIQS